MKTIFKGVIKNFTAAGKDVKLTIVCSLAVNLDEIKKYLDRELDISVGDNQLTLDELNVTKEEEVEEVATEGAAEHLDVETVGAL